MARIENGRISAAKFFSGAGTGMAIGGILGLIFFVIGGCENAKDQNTFKFKQALLGAAAIPKVAKLEGNWQDEVFRAMVIGEYLRNEHLENRNLENIINRAKKLSVVFPQVNAAETREALKLFLREGGVSEGIIIIAESSMALTALSDPKFIELLASIIEGKSSVPEVTYQARIVTDYLWLLIFLVQFGGAISYLIYWAAVIHGNYENYGPWYCLEWNKPWPYVTNILFLPGSFIPILLATILSLCCVDFKALAKRKDESLIAPPFNLDEFMGPSEKNLVLKLRQHLKREGGQ